MASLVLCADLGTILAEHRDSGFGVCISPYEERAPNIRDPVLQLCCHDASRALQPLLSLARSMVLTSGSLSPLDMYQQLLGMQSSAACSLPVCFPRQVVQPMVLTHGSDQLRLRSSEETEVDVIHNYGKLLMVCASTLPDGVVVYFASYAQMQRALREWDRAAILPQLTEQKLVFVESSDPVETAQGVERPNSPVHLPIPSARFGSLPCADTFLPSCNLLRSSRVLQASL